MPAEDIAAANDQAHLGAQIDGGFYFFGEFGAGFDVDPETLFARQRFA